MTSNLLHPSPVSTRFFTWCNDIRTFVAEASSLPVKFGRVYADACDEGLTLVSARTGREVVFVIDEIGHDEDDDLTHWDLVVAPGQPGANPDCRVRVFND